jgi:rhamnosyltransferase
MAILSQNISSPNACRGPEAGKRIGAVVVTYFPDGGFLGRLANMAAQADVTIVIDNTTDASISERLAEAVRSLGYEIISNEKNLGVATALNLGVQAAVGHGVDWILFFDQDSEPLKNFRDALRVVLCDYSGGAPLGIVGSTYVSHGTEKQVVGDAGAISYGPVDSVITSGSAYAVSMLSRLGRFKDKYFIDMIDVEYCWRASANGFQVLRITTPLLSHSIGAPTYYSILGMRTGTSNHAALRRYFMARNAVLLAREYFTKKPRATMGILIAQLKGLLLVALFEREKVKKVGFLFRGFWDGIAKVSLSDDLVRWI